MWLISQVYQTTKWFACITYFRYQECGGRILEEEGGAESETETDDNDSGTDSKDDGENSDNKDDEKVKPEESPSDLDMEIEGLAVEEAWAEPTGKKEEDESTEKIVYIYVTDFNSFGVANPAQLGRLPQ